MRKWASILLLSLGVFLGAGCKKPAGFEFRGITDIRVNQISDDSTELSSRISFFNPNSFGVQCKKVDADVFANDVFLTHYHLDTLIKISANSLFDLQPVIRFNTHLILNNMLSAVLSQGIKLRIVGSTKVGKAGFFTNIPFDFTSTQDLKNFSF